MGGEGLVTDSPVQSLGGIAMNRLIWLVLLLPMLAACGGDREKETAAPLSAPKSLDLGAALFCDVVEKSFAIHNRGKDEVRVWVEKVPPGFKLPHHALNAITVAASGKTEVVVSFSPRAIGAASGKLVLGYETDTRRRIEVDLVGEGMPNGVRVSPGDLDFGIVPLHGRKTLELHFDGQADATLQLMVAGDARSFDLDRTVVDVKAGRRSTVEVTFTPEVAGDIAGRVSISTCEGCEEQSVALRGQGGASRLVPEPAVLDFGTVFPGKSQVRELQLVNAGNMPIDVTSASFAHGSDRAFVADTRLDLITGVVGHHEAKTIRITFSPSSYAEMGEKTGSLLLHGEGGAVLVEIPLRGLAGGPNLTVSPTDIDFGILPLGVRGRHSIALSNHLAPEPAVIEEIYLEDPTGRFSFPLPLGERFQVAGEPVPVEIHFHAPDLPGGAELHEARLVIRTNDEVEGTRTVSLRARARELAPCETLTFLPEVNFGLVPVRANVREIKIENDGSDACGIWDVHLAEGAGAFQLNGHPERGVVLAPGEALRFGLTFDPAGDETSRLYSGALVFSHSGPGTEERVELTAYPGPYWLEISPKSIDFGKLPIGYEKPLAAVVLNHGMQAAIERVVVHQQAANFGAQARGDLPVALGGGGRLLAELSYTPGAAGFERAELQVFLEGVEEPVRIPMSGSGVAEPCDELCDAPIALCPPDETVPVNQDNPLVGEARNAGDASISCDWRIVGRPYGSRVQPSDPSDCATTFHPDLVGGYLLELRVSDGDREATCRTSITALPTGGVWAELFWEKASDVDLYVLHPAVDPAVVTNWRTEDALYHGAPLVDGRSTRTWDGSVVSLDRNDVTGTGPENILIERPVFGHRYAIGVHWNDSAGHASTWVTLNVFCGGVLAAAEMVTLNNDKDFVYFGTIQNHGIAGCLWRADRRLWRMDP